MTRFFIVSVRNFGPVVGIAPIRKEESIRSFFCNFTIVLLTRLFPSLSLCKSKSGVEIFGFANLANFWFGFSVFALKTAVFSVLVSCAVCRFSPIKSLVFGFWQQ